MAGTWTCTEDEDHGSLGDNLVRVTGAGATCADFVAADAAGEAVLLAATSCALNMTLSYQIRPITDIALTISFIIAAKTAEADYLWIVGTDWDGQAQTEDIDISAGNGTYNGTKKWRTITSIDVDDTSGAVEGNVAADGTLRVTQPRWGFFSDNGNGFFKLACEFNIGDGSTATDFTLQEGEALDATGFLPRATANATLNLGESSNTIYGKAPVFMKTKGMNWDNPISQANSTLNAFCASIVFSDSHLYCYGTVNLFRTTWSGDLYMWTNIYTATYDITDFYAYYSVLSITGGSGTSDTVHVEAGSGVGFDGSFGNSEVSDLLVTNSSLEEIAVGTANTLTVKDPRWTLTQGELSIGNASGEIHLVYTTNIHVTDKDGANLGTVQIVCDGSSNGSNYDTEQFDVNTAADGTITEQDLLTKKWVGTSETETDYNVHRFTLSKPGYQTLILENVTIAGAIDWHLELQPIRSRALGRGSRRMQVTNFE